MDHNLYTQNFTPLTHSTVNLRNDSPPANNGVLCHYSDIASEADLEICREACSARYSATVTVPSPEKSQRCLTLPGVTNRS